MLDVWMASVQLVIMVHTHTHKLVIMVLLYYGTVVVLT